MGNISLFRGLGSQTHSVLVNGEKEIRDVVRLCHSLGGPVRAVEWHS